MLRVEDGNNGATILFGSYVFKVDSSVGFCCYSLQDSQSDFPKDNLTSQGDLERKKLHSNNKFTILRSIVNSIPPMSADFLFESLVRFYYYFELKKKN